MCNHCPFVKHLADALAQFAAEYMAKGVAVVGISSNDVANYPADSPEQMVREAEERGYHVPVSVRRDAGSGQGVSRRLHARLLPVRSAIAGSSIAASSTTAGPDSGIPVTGADLRAAVDAVLAGKKPSEKQRPSIGCNIKWKPATSRIISGSTASCDRPRRSLHSALASE